MRALGAGLFALAAAPAAADPLAGSQAITLSVFGELRARRAPPGGQFRAGRSGSDLLFPLRSRVLAEIGKGRMHAGSELQDSRSCPGDPGTPPGPLNLLQACVPVAGLPGLPGPGSESEMTLRQQAISIGSSRQIERAGCANALFSYAGAHLVFRPPGPATLSAMRLIAGCGAGSSLRSCASKLAARCRSLARSPASHPRDRTAAGPCSVMRGWSFIFRACA